MGRLLSKLNKCQLGGLWRIELQAREYGLTLRLLISSVKPKLVRFTIEIIYWIFRSESNLYPDLCVSLDIYYSRSIERKVIVVVYDL